MSTHSDTPKKRIIVGISGASGAVYGVRLLEALLALEVESHLIITKAAQLTVQHELDMSLKEVQKLAAHYHACGDIAAPISSGSFPTDGMIVAPCSVKSLAEIAQGISSGLLPRAADVVLKERRKLVLMVRETPLHLGHIRNMAQVTEMGAIIAPPVPAFYTHPQSIDAIVNHSIARVLDLFGLHMPEAQRWAGMKQ